MPFYECVFITRQDISANEVDKLADNFADIISAEGGKVTKRENWGLRQLAYRIQKNRKGHYVLFNIDAPSSAVKEMERQMRINENLLRFMTVRVEALEEGPSAMMAKPRDYKEDGTDESFDFDTGFRSEDNLEMEDIKPIENIESEENNDK